MESFFGFSRKKTYQGRDPKQEDKEDSSSVFEELEEDTEFVKWCSCFDIWRCFGEMPRPDTVPSVTDNGWTILHEAARKGHGQCVKYLLKQPWVDVDCLFLTDITPLYLAASAGCFDAVKALIDAGCDVSIPNKPHMTPLLAALEKKSSACALYLARNGASIGGTDNSANSPLHKACKNRDAELVQLLLDRGANVSHINNRNQSPLFSAASRGEGNILNALLAKVKKRKLRDLLSRKSTFGGYTTLMVAARHGSVECVRSLLEAGADPNQSPSEHGFSIDHAIFSGNIECVNLIWTLIDQKAWMKNVLCKDMFDRAIHYQHHDVLKWLVELDWTPLDYALFQRPWYGFCHRTSWELDNHLWTEDVPRLVSPVGLAATQNNIQALEILWRLKPSVRGDEKPGIVSPLLLAVAGSHIAVCQWLLERAARITSDHILACTDPDCLRLLLKEGGDVLLFTQNNDSQRFHKLYRYRMRQDPERTSRLISVLLEFSPNPECDGFLKEAMDLNVTLPDAPHSLRDMCKSTIRSRVHFCRRDCNRMLSEILHDLPLPKSVLSFLCYDC